MKRSIKLWVCTGGLLLPFLAMTPVANAVSPETVSRSWKPSVELTGEGNKAVAVEKMREMADLQRVVMRNTEFHEQTQDFVDGLWASLERFDLRKFYNLLPEEQDDWRQLRVYGARDGSLYRMGPDVAVLGGEGAAADALLDMGDMSALIRAKQIKQEKSTNYLLSSTFKVGVGAVSWPSVIDATEETFRIVVDGDPQFEKTSLVTPDYRYRANVHAMNPALGEEDVAIIAPLWASFPEMWDLLAKLGKVEDVVLAGESPKPYKHLQASFVANPEMMKKYYPDLAKHLSKLDSLLQVSIDLHNEHGRVLHAEIDSETLRGRIDTYVYDGALLPVKDGRVLMNTEPTQSKEKRELVAHVNTRMNILGIVTRMSDIKATIEYSQTPQGAKIKTRMVDVPSVAVDGNALGIMPTSLINLFLPTNIDELMIEFLDVACKGNNGEGIAADLEFSQEKPGSISRLAVSSAFEGLDNFLVRLGMGIVSERVIPDPEVSLDIRRLIFDTQEAFSKDLDGYERLATL